MPTPHQAHNQGQRDVGQGKPSNPPHGVIDHVTAVSVGRQAEITRNNTAYQKGVDNANAQKKD